MSSFVNPDHHNRLITLPVVEDAFAAVAVSISSPGSIANVVEGAIKAPSLFYEYESGQDDRRKHAYNFPFLFHADGVPWIEANSFLYCQIRNQDPIGRPTDSTRREASCLLDYLIFCEQEGLDWKDFSGKRPHQRPTYRYFHHLKNSNQRSNKVINIYTGVVYRFYQHVSLYWHDIDLERVDTVKTLNWNIPTKTGRFVIERHKRSQTLTAKPISKPDYGSIRDEGEELRPLSNIQLKTLQLTIMEDDWSVQERLIVDMALMTGARKQTILTLRLKHLKSFTAETLRRDNTYPLRIGPGTGIDTKADKNNILYIPKQLANRLIIWANSDIAKIRQNRALLKKTLNAQTAKSDALNDMYVFLSEQGNCYYMAKNDPLYPFVKSPPKGQVTQTIKNKLLRISKKLAQANNAIPQPFTFHWLRATFAFQLYQYLQAAATKGLINEQDIISIIQIRLGHKHREVTESYLKLFKMIDLEMDAQEDWEDWLRGKHVLQ